MIFGAIQGAHSFSTDQPPDQGVTLIKHDEENPNRPANLLRASGRESLLAR